MDDNGGRRGFCPGKGLKGGKRQFSCRIMVEKFLRTPTRPVEIGGSTSISELLDKMGGASFQGRNLSHAYHVWKHMLSDRTTIFLGLAGALVPAGMRKLLVHIIENRWIDCLVSTGANLFHDIHETLGRYHWQGDPHVDDCELLEAGIDRIYDTFASEEEFRQTDEYIAQFAAGLDQTRPYSTKEFLSLLGKNLSVDGSQKGIVSAAFESGVPIYCPAIGDSSIGIAVAYGRYRGLLFLHFLSDGLRVYFQVLFLNILLLRRFYHRNI